MEVDGSVVEFPQQFFQFSRTAAVIPCGADIGGKHACQVDGHADGCPLRLGICGGFLQQKISCDDSKQDSRSVAECICPFFSVAISFISQNLFFMVCNACKGNVIFVFSGRYV